MTNSAEIKEIDRYVDNARKILSDKAGKHGDYYKDKKYVQMASGTAYNAVLMVADEFLKQKEGQKFTKPTSIEDYRKRITKHNKSFIKLLDNAYDNFHLLGYYHGSLRVKAMQEGFASLEKMKKML